MIRRRVWSALLVVGLATSGMAQSPGDADVRRGIALVEEGEYDSAILTLDNAVRRLAATKGHSSADLAEAYFHLGVAYLGKGHETSAKARFRDAVHQMREMSPSPEKFPPRVIELFEKAREESRAAAPATAPVTTTASAPVEAAPKKGGSKTLLVIGGVALVGGGAALAAGGGGGSGAGNTPDAGPLQVHTETAWVQDGEPAFVGFVASRPGTVDVTITWQNRNVDLPIGCQLRDPPYTDCRGTYSRATDTSGRFTATVTQAAYLLSVNHFAGRGEPENFTITVRYP